MEAKYKFGHRPGKRRRTRLFIIFSITLAIVSLIVVLVVLDLRRNNADTVEGNERTIVQVADEGTLLRIDEDFFSLELPSDWEETARANTAKAHTIAWRSTKEHESSRFLKVYIDIIPKNYAVNRMLPVSARGNALVLGEASEACNNFTQPDAGQRQDETKLAKWQGVEFLCELGSLLDNETGTSSEDGVNTITLTGSRGTHSYFFVYTDRTLQPDYTIFINALKSFRVK